MHNEQKRQGVQSILLRAKAKGQGVVNFDSESQSFTLNNLKINILKAPNVGGITVNNVKYSKKTYHSNPDGTYGYKLVVSSNCAKYNLYSEMKMTGPNTNHSFIYLPKVATIPGLLRGHLITNQSGIQFNRASPITLRDFIQTCNTPSYIETYTKSGQRTSTSLFYRENIGNVEYSSTGTINLKALQFVSLDARLGMAFDVNDFNKFEGLLQKESPSFNSKPMFFHEKGNIDTVPVFGFKLDNQTQLECIKYYLKNLMTLEVKNQNGDFNVTEVEYKLVYDSLTDVADDPNGWVTLYKEDIDTFDIDIKDFYDVDNSENGQEAIRLTQEYLGVVSDNRENKKKDDALRKEAKEKKKTK